MEKMVERYPSKHELLKRAFAMFGTTDIGTAFDRAVEQGKEAIARFLLSLV